MEALLQSPKNRCIVERFNLSELNKIIELPVNVDFFDQLSVVDESFTSKHTLRQTFTDWIIGKEMPFSYMKDLNGLLR